MYLIFSLPYEINDEIIIHLNNFSVAVQYKRFWTASQLIQFDELIQFDKLIQFPEDDLLGIIPFLDDKG